MGVVRVVVRGVRLVWLAALLYMRIEIQTDERNYWGLALFSLMAAHCLWELYRYCSRCAFTTAQNRRRATSKPRLDLI